MIQAQLDQEVLYLKVTDNGRGMTAEQIAGLLDDERRQAKGLSSIGIANVRDRLVLNYGADAGLRYESSAEGTTAIIFITVKQEEADEKGTDCR